MRLTYRLAALAACGIVPLLFAGRLPWLLPLVLVFDLLLAAAATADFLASPRPENALSAERAVDDKLSLGTANPVSVTLRNASGMALRVTCRDYPPYQFDVSPSAEKVLTLPPTIAPQHLLIMSRRTPRVTLRLTTFMFSIPVHWGW